MSHARRARPFGAAIAALLCAAAISGCRHTAKPDTQVETVVAGPASRWASIDVGRAARGLTVVPAELRRPLAPMLATRRFATAVAAYGLDHPVATITYRATTGAPVLVDVGASSFDRRFVYVERRGEPGAFFVPWATLQPVLALVDVQLPAPVG